VEILAVRFQQYGNFSQNLNLK